MFSRQRVKMTTCSILYSCFHTVQYLVGTRLIGEEKCWSGVLGISLVDLAMPVALQDAHSAAEDNNSWDNRPTWRYGARPGRGWFVGDAPANTLWGMAVTGTSLYSLSRFYTVGADAEFDASYRYNNCQNIYRVYITKTYVYLAD